MKIRPPSDGLARIARRPIAAVLPGLVVAAVAVDFFAQRPVAAVAVSPTPVPSSYDFSIRTQAIVLTPSIARPTPVPTGKSYDYSVTTSPIVLTPSSASAPSSR